jgi:two-component system, NtrC family, response regulator AtoC
MAALYVMTMNALYIWHTACSLFTTAERLLAGEAQRVEQPRVLIVEPDPIMRHSLSAFLGSRGYQCVLATSIEEALEPLASNDFRLTLLDLEVEGASGPDLIPRLRLQGGYPGPIIGLVSAKDWKDGDGIALVVDAILIKPFTETQLDQAINEVAAASARPAVAAPGQGVARVRRETELWRSPKMRQVVEIIREAARVDITVLVTGETGTGKDLVARAIHFMSSRRGGPFVKVNCAAVPRELLESELFGHERGAFTGAHKLKIGKFEEAHRGTIFLDEIGDLHPALQAKLLHVLQDGEFSRVGGRSALKVDVRVIAATNQDLERAVSEHRFREDLFYRLNVVQIVVPPLRERVDEIPLLVDYFVKVYSKLFRREGFFIPPNVVERLRQHRYPGNVRELENLIKRMIVLGDPLLSRVPGLERSVTPPATPAPSNPAAAQPIDGLSLKAISRQAARSAERDAIWTVLEHTGWNRVRAAKTLRISYRALLYKMKEVGLTGGRANGHLALRAVDQAAGWWGTLGPEHPTWQQQT